MAPVSLFLPALALLAAQVSSQTVIVPAHHQTEEPSQTQWISGPDGFDAPKVHPINRTTYDWWYFDLVQERNVLATGQQPSFTATFRNSGQNGAFPNNFPSDNFVGIDMAWPNGSTYSWMFMAGEVVLTTVEGTDGTSGNWTSSGTSFGGTPDMSLYSIHVDAPDQGLVGSLYIQSETPPHYPCGPAEAGQDMHFAPGTGWANAIPDGYGEAHFKIFGEDFRVQGRGYHDHSFGDRPLDSALETYYWGHGRLGEYAFVWADMLTPSGQNSVSGYVARNNEIVLTGCDGVRVRPYGENSTYPPLFTSGAPTGFTIDIATPEGPFELRAETIYLSFEGLPFRQWTGRLTGTLNGERLPDGVALWQQSATRH